MRSGGSALVATLLLAGCAGRGDRVGLSSWYGDAFAGRPTASGRPFDPAAMTAAHRTLPLGTIARVTDVATGRSVTVLVNDRGPARRSRVIDLSHAAAQALGTDRRPQDRVRIEPVAGSPSAPPARMRSEASRSTDGRLAGVQVATFASLDHARALAETLGGRVEPAGRLYRVRLGPFATTADAQRARDDAVARGYGDAIVFDAN